MIFTHPIILIGLGGAIGANARYFLGKWIKSYSFAHDFFWGTLLINISGSLLLGLIAVLFRDRASVGFLFLGTGFCGGYTTFSTFSLEMLEFIQRDRVDLALIYSLSSVTIAVLACWFAWWITNKLIST